MAQSTTHVSRMKTWESVFIFLTPLPLIQPITKPSKYYNQNIGQFTSLHFRHPYHLCPGHHPLSGCPQWSPPRSQSLSIPLPCFVFCTAFTPLRSSFWVLAYTCPLKADSKFHEDRGLCLLWLALDPQCLAVYCDWWLVGSQNWMNERGESCNTNMAAGPPTPTSSPPPHPSLVGSSFKKKKSLKRHWHTAPDAKSGLRTQGLGWAEP